MRADAQQNRQRLLDAAEDLFAQHGTAVSVAQIVTAAGVGAPTLYRHFGDKDGLVRAIGERRSELAMGRLGHALTRSSGWDGLRAAVADAVDLASRNRAVREQRGVAISPALERMLLAGWAELVRRGHEEGSIREDFTATDVPFLFAAAAGATAALPDSPALVDRYVSLVMDGIRPSPRPMAGRPPTGSELRHAFGPRV